MSGRGGRTGRSNRTPRARPRQRRADLSQHFLRDSSARRVVNATSITRRDLVIEAGAGTGELTSHLADRAERVIAVELDRTLHAQLERRFRDADNVTVRGGDFLAYSLPAGPYTFVANVPYSRTAEIVRKIALGKRPAKAAYLVLETASARRFLGQPFGPESALSLMIKARFQIAVLDWLGPEEFSPPPSVNSVLLALTRRHSALLTSTELRDFDRFAREVFKSGAATSRNFLRSLLPRRTIRSLTTELGLTDAAAPSNIAFDHWLTLFNLNQRARP